MALDMKIIEDSGGKLSFDDVIKEVNLKHQYGNGEVNYKELIDIIKRLTDKDYTQFFNDYVYGSKFLDLDKYFADNDRDGLQNYVEIYRGTDPNKYDVFETKLKDLFN
jgi:predicted metalloprotease with PDZ domain